MATDKLRPAFTIVGFVFGASASGFAISNSIVSFLVILSNSISTSGGLTLSLSLSKEIAIVLCVGILILGFLILRGSLMIWRLSVLGGAINLASGIVLAGFSYAMISVVLSLLEPVYGLVFAETILMSLFAMISGMFALIALFEQLQRRFSPSDIYEGTPTKVSVALPTGDVLRINCRMNEKISDLRKKIEDTDEKVENAAMIFRGKKITNESQTLKDLGFREGDTITLV